jgi:hypothetical protein
MKFIKYIKRNYWRFTPDSWVDWGYYWYSNIKEKILCWWFWYSFPWEKYRRCPLCAGECSRINSYDEMICEMCNGTGKIKKS